MAPMNGLVGRPMGKGEVGDTVNYQCSSEQNTADVQTATCTAGGSWSPNLPLLTCNQTPAETTSNASLTTSNVTSNASLTTASLDFQKYPTCSNSTCKFDNN